MTASNDITIFKRFSPSLSAVSSKLN